MGASFVTSLPLHHQWQPATTAICPCRPNLPKKRVKPSLQLMPIATVASNASLSTSIREDHIEPEQDEKSIRRWRTHNTSLVKKAQTHGLDAAIELLWRLSADGQAATQNFNQVVSLLANHNRFDDGLALADEAGRRDMTNIITFRPLMKYCCANGDGLGAKKVWKTMARHGVCGDMFLYAELMGALVRSQELMSAHKVLNSLLDAGRRPHVVLYNTLMKGYAKTADIKRGFDTLKMIENANVRPDETTFNTLLNICVRGKDMKSVNKVLGLMRKYQIKPGAPTFNTLLKMYSRAGKFDDAMAIYREMQETVEPSIVTYNTMIDGCAHRGDMERAGSFFDEMIEKGFAPDICTMTSLLKGFGRAGEPVKAKELFEAMKEGGFRIEERTRYAVINACLRARDRKGAKNYLNEMKEAGCTIRARTWVWLLESDIWADDEDSAIETISLMYECKCMLDYSKKAMLLKEVRDRGGLLRLQRELKAAVTYDNRDRLE